MGNKELLGLQNGDTFWKNWVLLQFYLTISKYWVGISPLTAPGLYGLELQKTTWMYSTKQFFCYINYLSYRHNYILWWKECSLCIIHTFHKKRKSNPITFHIYVCVFLTSSCSRTYSRVHQGHSSRGGKTAPTISIFWDCHIRMHWNLILPKKSNPFCCSINSLSPQCSGPSYASVSMRKYLL